MSEASWSAFARRALASSAALRISFARNAFRSGKWVDMAKRCKKSADNYLNFIYTCLSTIKALAKEDVALYADLIKAQRAEFVQYTTNIAQMLGSVVSYRPTFCRAPKRQGNSGHWRSEGSASSPVDTLPTRGHATHSHRKAFKHNDGRPKTIASVHL